MEELDVHTLIVPENREGCLLLCGLNHGYSKEDERQDLAGIDRADSNKSFFSDCEVNNYAFRNKIVNWFSLWGYELNKTKATATQFDKSIVQTNWLQTCSNNLNGVGIQRECIENCESFLNTCKKLRPGLILFFGRELIWAFSHSLIASKIEGVFGQKLDTVQTIKKDILGPDGIKRKPFAVSFVKYERVTVVCLHHATGSKGLANDYIAAFKPELSYAIDGWWKEFRAFEERSFS